jgi:predicted ABC-type ATPase
MQTKYSYKNDDTLVINNFMGKFFQNNTIQKTRIYVESVQDAPRGVNLQYGKHGGIYYESRESSEEQSSPQQTNIAHTLDHAWESIHSMRNVAKLYKVLDGVNNSRTSRNMYIDRNTGEYTPERLQLHERIMNEFIGENSLPRNGEMSTALLVGGPPASGKSTILKHKNIKSSDFTYVNSDDIQERLPGYTGVNAMLYHDEARDIHNKLVERSLAEKRNIIIDGTMRNVEKETKKIARLKELGYKIKVVSVQTKVELLITRATKRFMTTGRYIPLHWIAKEGNNINEAQKKYKDMVDEYELWDSSYSPSRRIL